MATGEPGPRPGGPVRNEVTATSVNALVQAGVVHDGLHIHPAPDLVVPRQLPAAPSLFTGRAEAVAELDRVLAAPPGESRADAAAPLSVIVGAGGMGKTWLALTWAHRGLDRFPDGQLFVDLRGFGPEVAPVDPAVVIRGFLGALGVEAGRVPVDGQARGALYRSLVARRRMLILLDNAADAAQVVPLLPGGQSCAVLVTSRRTSTTLIARHGAHHLALDPLGPRESRALLARRLGARRVAAERGAVAELTGLCGGFPLALGIIAARAQAHHRLPLGDLAAELRDLRLGALTDTDPATSLPAVLSWSHRALTAEQRTVFGLLGWHPASTSACPPRPAWRG